MAGVDNLIPITSTDVARELGSKGGKAASEARKRRRTLREELIALLESEDMQERMSLALIKEATMGNSAGSVARAFETVRDTIGEKPIEKVLFADVDAGVAEQIESMVLGK